MDQRPNKEQSRHSTSAVRNRRKKRETDRTAERKRKENLGGSVESRGSIEKYDSDVVQGVKIRCLTEQRRWKGRTAKKLGEMKCSQVAGPTVIIEVGEGGGESKGESIRRAIGKGRQSRGVPILGNGDRTGTLREGGTTREKIRRKCRE